MEFLRLRLVFAHLFGTATHVEFPAAAAHCARLPLVSLWGPDAAVHLITGLALMGLVPLTDAE